MKAKVRKTIAHLREDGAISQAAMELHPVGETLSLRGSQHMHLHAGPGRTVRVLAGTVWIVQDGDIRDMVLEAGERIVLDRTGPALLSPLGEARIAFA